MATAGALQTTSTLLGILGAMVPLGPKSITALGVLPSWGSTRTNGTPLNIFGFQSEKTNRSICPSGSKNIPRSVTELATVAIDSGTYLPLVVKNSKRSFISSRFI